MQGEVGQEQESEQEEVREAVALQVGQVEHSCGGTTLLPAAYNWGVPVSGSGGNNLGDRYAIITLGISDAVFQLLPTKLQHGHVIDVLPVMFTQVLHTNQVQECSLGYSMV